MGPQDLIPKARQRFDVHTHGRHGSRQRVGGFALRTLRAPRLFPKRKPGEAGLHILVGNLFQRFAGGCHRTYRGQALGHILVMLLEMLFDQGFQ
jgi:hypothetical protein